VPPTSPYRLCTARWYKRRETQSWLNSEGEHRAFSPQPKREIISDFFQCQACADHHGCLGSGYRCSASFTCYQLRPTCVSGLSCCVVCHILKHTHQKSRELHPSYRSFRSLWSQGCRHQRTFLAFSKTPRHKECIDLLCNSLSLSMMSASSAILVSAGPKLLLNSLTFHASIRAILQHTNCESTVVFCVHRRLPYPFRMKCPSMLQNSSRKPPSSCP
jgi:hypothetical protein